MKGIWKKLTPQFFEDVEEPMQQGNIINDLVEMTNQLDLHLNENDFIKLLESHRAELNNEDSMELEEHRSEGNDLEEFKETKEFVTKQMEECFNLIGVVGLKAQDPDTDRFTKANKPIQIMGKVRKSRAKSEGIGKNIKEDATPPEVQPFLPAAFSNVVPKDFDLASVRSLKSIKNKFGIKKHITKTEKLKLRKEILKQKMDLVMEASEVYSKSGLKLNTQNLKKKTKKQNEISEHYCEGFIGKFNNIIDQDEEYLKLGRKNIGVPKRKKRRQLMVNDINSLKTLMAQIKRTTPKQ